MGSSLDRRQFLSAGSGALAGALVAGRAADARAQPGKPGRGSRPNVVVVILDDLGQGDFGCYGSPLIDTPHIDRLAHEGIRFTQAYSGAPTCTPSRAALMTGRVPTRVGLPRVLFPNDRDGLSHQERTIAEYLGESGYACACIGKWHLGARPEHNPLRHGFDRFFGLLYSHDMSPLQLWRDEQVVEDTVDQTELSRRYTEEAISFMDEADGRPFMIYLAHSMPHIPLAVEPRFAGVSEAGPYGDVVEALDHYVGQLLAALRDRDLERDTLVILTSDNGPWFEGRTSGLRGRKGEAYEGGMRTPFIARWPHVIPRNKVSDAPISFVDVLPTLCSFAGVEPDPDVTLDGSNLREALGNDDSPHAPIYYYLASGTLAAIRDERWKLHVHRDGPDQRQLPQLFDLERDPQECYDLEAKYPRIAERLRDTMKRFDADVRMKDGVLTLEGESLLPALSATAPILQQGNCCGVAWSSGAQLWFRAEQPGDNAVLEFFVPQDGSYELLATLTRSWNYGIVQLGIDGQSVGAPFNGYGPQVAKSGPIRLGTLGLDAGAHALTLSVTGKDARSTNHQAGLDVLVLHLV